ncbi:NAD(P)-binding protein [Aureobasidium sp. EXF-3400]|nr:NAD(P)-binding protein [Aureobasidium sp. EXF-12344]KAI4778303.1 NAD(P)-binding protein [Aureobasidium sp. EXF-3400]
MSTIKNVAILGASGNFGTPITSALLAANFNLTIITRTTSTTSHPPSIPTLRIDYTLSSLTTAFANQDAVICVVGPGGISLQKTFIDAAVAAGVSRFIIDDFGWGLTTKGFAEFSAIHAQRREGWDHARSEAEEVEGFTWTGLSTGNPIDWAMKKFPMMGFDVQNHSAIIYDSGTEHFTGTTLQGIGQAVVGTLLNPSATANRFLRVQSICTTQNELLAAFEKATGEQWKVERQKSYDLIQSGKDDFETGAGMWRLKLAVATLYDVGQSRGMVAATRDESDAELLGVKDESAEEIVAKLLQ